VPKVFIVDDDPDVRHALRVRLRAIQYDTVSPGDGYSALALTYKDRPNLILLDLGLPAGVGFLVLDLPRRDEKLARTPVVVVSARERLSFEQRHSGCGCDRLLAETGQSCRTARVEETICRGAAKGE
jgi:DNA-binding response OmpR family regulator